MLMLAGIVVLHITGIILLLVATIDNAWWITDKLSTDLWGRWELNDLTWHYTNQQGYADEFTRVRKLAVFMCVSFSVVLQSLNICQTVQATSVLSCVFTILALFVFVAQLFTLPKGQRFTFTGVLQLIACLCIMIAASIYTAELHTDDKVGGYGHSYVLAWISFVLTFFSAITYLVLRKKSE
ncbi:Epithelial membrane protein 2 [Nibea albiflora]|uniref:Epithelial membrane protein 2 n=1 Tax=Nibea albiflora TaxID=240163 RepID=A0ACB7FK69_NIBAL|nr:Epithelial membrane protein 2 [Nibea albiflora]